MSDLDKNVVKNRPQCDKNTLSQDNNTNVLLHLEENFILIFMSKRDPLCACAERS